jgi:HSP20 family molecular chaperone IbpA
MAENEKGKKSVEARRPAEQAAEEAMPPLVDIYEAEDGSTVLLAELPGATPETLDVRVDKGVLTISADGPLPEVGEEYAETYVGFVGGRFFRAFALSDEVDREKVEASLADGLLTVKLPKAAAARTRKIQIK